MVTFEYTKAKQDQFESKLIWHIKLEQIYMMNKYQFIQTTGS